jgi:hypothetical protein
MKLRLYNSWIRPILEYGFLVLSSAPRAVLRLLDKCQKECLLIVLGAQDGLAPGLGTYFWNRLLGPSSVHPLGVAGIQTPKISSDPSLPGMVPLCFSDGKRSEKQAHHLPTYVWKEYERVSSYPSLSHGSSSVEPPPHNATRSLPHPSPCRPSVSLEPRPFLCFLPVSTSLP